MFILPFIVTNVCASFASVWVEIRRKLKSETGVIHLYYILTVIQARAHVLDDVISSVFRGYKSEVRPYCNKANNTVVVTVDIGVRQVVDLVMNWLRRVSNIIIMQWGIHVQASPHGPERFIFKLQLF